MGEVLDPVTALTSIGQQVQYSTGSLARLSEILDAEPEIVDDPAASDLPALASAITFDRVSFSYRGGSSGSGSLGDGRRVLSDVDLAIPAGQRVAFVGPSGAGKSSVLALLQRVYDPDEGAVRFDGHDLRDVRLRSVREQIGVVFQDTFCFDNGSIRENIAMGRAGCSDHDIEQAARAAELHEFVASLPAGYDTPVGSRGSRLSGGQRQRLALARALVRNPRVLVLDEATSALDPRTERLITDTLERVAVGRTTVAVTHRLASVVGYDRIYVLREGRVVEAGTARGARRPRGTVRAALGRADRPDVE